MTKRQPGSRRGLGFWAYVKKSEDCWVWTGSTTKFGYGQTRGTKYGLREVDLAHRVSWVIHHGAPPPGACVLHRCDNPPCVRPDHLFLGTKRENTRDMMTKGRGKFGPQPFASRTHGTRNAHAKLTEEQVVEMRRRAIGGERYQDLAVAYGISESRANAVINGNGWRHVWPFNQLAGDRA